MLTPQSGEVEAFCPFASASLPASGFDHNLKKRPETTSILAMPGWLLLCPDFLD